MSTPLLNLFKFALFFFCSGSFAADCSYSIKKNGGKAYNEGSVTDFVISEIRPELRNEDKAIYIEITSSCGQKPDEVITLKMSTLNFYILGINNKNIPKHIADYNNRLALEINNTSFSKVIGQAIEEDFSKFPDQKSAVTYADKKQQIKQQRILKMFAFVFAEAARFESAEKAVRESIDGDCTVDWHDFDFAVHNWRNISVFVSQKNIKLEKQRSGGGQSQLHAPILVEQEEKFDGALMAGESFDFSAAAPLLDPYSFDCSLK
ncbi:MAG: hypothetical protein Q7T74_05260 [Candidatus Saccharibacteria bacterium]|nr:hypothetical protein [Candidatus Saccharibacteria bacterium]